MARTQKAMLTALGTGALVLGGAAPAAAIPAAGVLEPTVLAIFDTERPADGLLYGLGVTTGATDALRVYRIDGAATAIGAGGVSATTAAHYDVDFNPVPDRMRVINGADANLRLNPNSGVLSGLDVSLTAKGTLPVPLDGLAVGAPVTPPVPATTTTTVTVSPSDRTPPGYLLQALATTRQATLSLGRSTVATATTSPADPGNGKLKLQLSKTGAAKLKSSLARKPSVSLKLRLTLTDQARNARTVTKTFRARR